MAVTSHIVEVSGEEVGHAMTLGERYEFPTQRESVSHLNEQKFQNLAALREAVEASIKLQ